MFNQAYTKQVELLLKALPLIGKYNCFALKQGVPDWSIISVKHLEKLPALQWKLQNIARIPKDKHTASLDKLKRVLKV